MIENWGSIKVWPLGVLDHILDEKYGFCKKIGVVYGFPIAARLGEEWNLNNRLTVFVLLS